MSLISVLGCVEGHLPTNTNNTLVMGWDQVVWIADIEGWDCSALSTLTTHIFGLWGYKKAVPLMSGRTLMKLMPTQCNQIVKWACSRPRRAGPLPASPRPATRRHNIM